MVNNKIGAEGGIIPSEYVPPKKKGCDGLYNRIFKRLVDFCLALVLSVLVTPVVIAVGAVIAAESGFPVFYTPQRGGYKGKTFRIFKFRTMIKNADRLGGGTTALNDPRITRIGRILRKTKLDEIPQIYNVLLGTMSFVGPRPELLMYTEGYTDDEKLIFKVRPGITDFSSIEFINLDEIVGEGNADEIYEKYVLKRKNALRVKYACEVSLKTDATLFLKTVFSVFKKATGALTKQEGDGDGIHNT